MEETITLSGVRNWKQHWINCESFSIWIRSLGLMQLTISVFVCTVSIVLVLWVCKRNTVSNFVLRALRVGGPIPRHVAFIMDGNRRWARRGGLMSHQGHSEGGETLIKCLEWCMEIGVKVVTVYAFSIENFKRSQIEVEEIMSLAERKFQFFCSKKDIIHSNRIRVRVLGDLSLIPTNLRAIMSQVMMETMHYTEGPTLNICFAYTARHDIASSIADLVNLRKENRLKTEDISESTIASCLSTGCAKGAACGNGCPDLLVRTSGETRLSDFLLWESGNSILSFYPTLWPDMTAWDFAKLILQYQRLCRSRTSPENNVTKEYTSALPSLQSSTHFCKDIGSEVLDGMRSNYLDTISSYVNTS